MEPLDYSSIVNLMESSIKLICLYSIQFRLCYITHLPTKLQWSKPGLPMLINSVLFVTDKDAERDYVAEEDPWIEVKMSDWTPASVLLWWVRVVSREYRSANIDVSHFWVSCRSNLGNDCKSVCNLTWCVWFPLFFTSGMHLGLTWLSVFIHLCFSAIIHWWRQL